MRRLALFLFAIVVLFSCQKKGSFSRLYQAEEPSTTKNIGETDIVYSFQDASVPPDDHRSYSIILSDSSYRFIVDSYGEIIKDTMMVLENQSQKILDVMKSFQNHNIKNLEREADDFGCTGGTGESIKIIKDGKVYFFGSNYYCGGTIDGNLSGNTKGFLQDLKKEIDSKFFEFD